MPPRVSIVVTCHDYAHFLGACLASLARQTRPPDQVIVVDDGSTDASAGIARGWPGGAIVLEQPNRGQASAFNAGFARATGEMVLFLDADDALEPDALEILRGAWHPELAAIGFRLNLIDAAGRPEGFYPVEPPDGDMRPDLLTHGHFRFVPTSGNAFTRSRVAPAFPLPEARWRISADAVLLRVAALAGPIRQLPFALANYRNHGGNAYHRAALPALAFQRRGVRDAADACLAVADLRDDAVFGVDPDAQRLDLLLAFVRRRLSLTAAGEPGPQALRAVRTALPRILRLRIGLRARAAFALGLALLPLALRAAPITRQWIQAEGPRPWLIDRALSAALGEALAGRRRALRRPRQVAPAARHPAPEHGDREAAFYNPFDWRDAGSGFRRVLCHAAGEVLLPLDHAPHGVRLAFDLAVARGYADVPIDVALGAAGERLAQARIAGRGRLSVMLEPGRTLAEAGLLLELSARPAPRRLRRRLSDLFRPAAMLEVTGLSVEPIVASRSGVALALGETRAYPEIAEACQVEPYPDPRAGPVEAGRLVLALIRPTPPRPSELVLRFGEAQVAGVLVVAGPAGPLWRGPIGRRAEVRASLAPRAHRDDRSLLLTLELDPDDPFEPAAFDLSTLALTSADPSPGFAPPAAAFPLLVPGALHSFETQPQDAAILAEGWTQDETGALLFDTLGLLRFAIDPAAAEDAELHLRIAPVATLPPDVELAVAVSIEGEVAAHVLLQGEHELAVPLRAALRRGARRIELAIHSALTQRDAAAGELRRGGLTLRALRLSASTQTPAPPRTRSDRPAETLGGMILAAGLRARALRDAGPQRPEAELADLETARTRILGGLATLARRACGAALLDEPTLHALLDLSGATDRAGARPVPQAGGSLCAEDPGDAARAAAIAFLTCPPWRALAGGTPKQINEVLRAFPAPMARYLCAQVPIETPDDHALYEAFVLELYRYAHASFTAEPRGGRHSCLAEQILLRLQPHPLLFGPGGLRELAAARGRAIEAYLIARGRRITWVRDPAPAADRLRVGVLLRDLRAAPETWIFAGTLGALPAARFAITVFVLDGAREDGAPDLPGTRVVDLGGVDVDRAVDTIRAAELDVLLLGSFFLGYDRLAAIAAHRLAPRQIASTAVSPMTTGFLSFDVMLGHAGCEPPDAASHYTERLLSAPQPVQRYDFGPARGPATPSRALGRARLGIPPDATVLVSGALLHKIGPDLMAAWIEILARAPDAVLALYPFAANWRLPFARRGFERALRALAQAKGVAPGRVILLEAMPHPEVGALLDLADLYLDSFPYAGATTVVEALRRGLPAVALAGDSQRGLQGAAWLRSYGLGDCVAQSRDAYVALAVRLAADPARRAAAAAAVRPPEELGAEAFGLRFGALLFDAAGWPAQPPPPPRLLFHHMPKAGGSTCRAVFGAWFALRDDDRAPWACDPPPPPLDLGAIVPEEMVCGHFGSSGYLLRARYPRLLADPAWRLITFLRDPLETALSYYFFERAHRPRADPGFSALDLDEYLAACPLHLSQHLAAIDDDWRVALDRYWFVGAAERLDEGLRWLGAALGKPMPAIPRLNPSARPEQPSPEAVADFARRQEGEFVIWRAAAARCAAILASDPSDALTPERMVKAMVP